MKIPEIPNIVSIEDKCGSFNSKEEKIKCPSVGCISREPFIQSASHLAGQSQRPQGRAVSTLDTQRI